MGAPCHSGLGLISSHTSETPPHRDYHGRSLEIRQSPLAGVNLSAQRLAIRGARYYENRFDILTHGQARGSTRSMNLLGGGVDEY